MTSGSGTTASAARSGLGPDGGLRDSGARWTTSRPWLRAVELDPEGIAGAGSSRWSARGPADAAVCCGADPGSRRGSVFRLLDAPERRLAGALGARGGAPDAQVLRRGGAERLDVIAEALRFAVPGAGPLAWLWAIWGRFPAAPVPESLGRARAAAVARAAAGPDRAGLRGHRLSAGGSTLQPHVTLGRVREGQRLPPGVGRSRGPAPADAVRGRAAGAV